jgi:hypothetical protein
MITRTADTPVSRRAKRPEPSAWRVPAKVADSRSSVSANANPVRAVFGRTEPTKREIRDRAYYIYLARGGANGDPASDWLQAERELREELHAAAFASRRI